MVKLLTFIERAPLHGQYLPWLSGLPGDAAAENSLYYKVMSMLSTLPIDDSTTRQLDCGRWWVPVVGHPPGSKSKKKERHGLIGVLAAAPCTWF